MKTELNHRTAQYADVMGDGVHYQHIRCDGCGECRLCAVHSVERMDAGHFEEPCYEEAIALCDECEAVEDPALRELEPDTASGKPQR